MKRSGQAFALPPILHPQPSRCTQTPSLKARGLRLGAPDNHPQAIELLHDEADLKRMRHAGGDEIVYLEADSSEYLSPVEMEAARRLHGLNKPTLSDALDLHLKVHPKRGNQRFVDYQRRAFAGLIAVTGDKAIDDFRRADARAYLDATLLKVKTTTVRRLIGAVSAVFATYIKENDLTRTNPFASLPIDAEGHDAEKRSPFTPDELVKLVQACSAKDDAMRWLLLILAGTGARLAEIVGLPLDDIHTEAEFPHVHLQVHPWRDIKGANGIRGKKDRAVPLVGVALWAAKRVKESAIDGQKMAFPQYTDETECRATSASAALNGWIRRLPLEHTCHDLRHTMKDLLRAVQCPKEINDAITGHGKKDTGDGYGKGYGYNLEVNHEWMLKVAL